MLLTYVVCSDSFQIYIAPLLLLYHNFQKIYFNPLIDVCKIDLRWIDTSIILLNVLHSEGWCLISPAFIYATALYQNTNWCTSNNEMPEGKICPLHRYTCVGNVYQTHIWIEYVWMCVMKWCCFTRKYVFQRSGIIALFFYAFYIDDTTVKTTCNYIVNFWGMKQVFLLCRD